MDAKIEEIPVIILAAGDSNRMGQPKGLIQFKGKPFLSHQIEWLLQIGFAEIIVVLGRDTILYQRDVPELKKTTFIVNPEPERGQFSSVQCGLQIIANMAHEGVFILPIDVPSPKKDVWLELRKGIAEAKVDVIVPEFEGKKGHPVLIKESFMKELLEKDIESRLDYEIKKKNVKIISCRDKNIVLNLNTPEEWKKYEEEK